MRFEHLNSYDIFSTAIIVCLQNYLLALQNGLQNEEYSRPSRSYVYVIYSEVPAKGMSNEINNSQRSHLSSCLKFAEVCLVEIVLCSERTFWEDACIN